MRARTFLALGLALVAGGATAVDTGETAQHIVQGTNAFRRAQGVEPVGRDRDLTAAAQAFARYMAKTGKFAHTADGRQPSERAAAQGYDYCIVSENIASQFRSRGFASAAALAQTFVEGWKNSPEHRANLTDAAVTQIGVAVAQDQEGRYFAVQMFGRPRSASVRFSVANRSRETVRYSAADQRFTLEPRVMRTHAVCRPTSLTIERPGQARPFEALAENGARYTITEGHVKKGP